MVQDVFEQSSGGDRVGWMELQLRRARDKVSQLEAIVAESSRQIRNFTERVNEMEMTIQSYSTQVELSRQVQSSIGRLKEQVTALDEKVQAAVRQTTDAGKLREAQSRVETQERGVNAKRLDEMERTLQAVDSRMVRNVDFERKINERMDGLQRDFEVSRRELLSETERNRVQLEQFRRIDEKLAQIEEVRGSFEDLRQQLEVRQVEQMRGDHRIAEVEQQVEDLRKSLPGVSDKAARLESSLGGYLERMAAVEEVVDQGQKGVVERLLRFAEAQEQQRRRQIEDLQKEIRELRRYAARLREDAPPAEN
jgi:chromosome segregation ATPase